MKQMKRMRHRWIAVVAMLVTTPAVAADDIPMAGRDVERPARTSYTPPDQSISEALRIMGLILIELTLHEDGRPLDYKILRGIRSLNAPTIQAALTWRYEPTVVDGIPRRVRILEGVEYLLDTVTPYDYSGLASKKEMGTDARLYALWRMQQLPPTRLKKKAKTLQLLQSDEDPPVAQAATAALARLQVTH